MRYLYNICILLLIFLVPLFNVLAQEQNSDSSPQSQSGLRFDKIIIAIGMFAVISAAFLNWESRNKKKKSNDQPQNKKT